jgi:hypothetical protein
MSKWLKQFGPIVVTLAMLGYIAGFAKLRIATEGVAEFRERSRVAMAALPEKVGLWEATRQQLDARAKDLLQPNAESTLLYKDRITSTQAYYSVIQVKDSRYMTGHAPMNCYPGNGFTIKSQVDRVWRVGEMDVKGIEYVVTRTLPDGKGQIWNVRSFYIFPDGHFGATLRELDQAAEDYRKLAYGVAQVQLVTFDPRLTDKQRDDIFSTLVGSERSLELIRTLRTGIPR